MLKLILSLLIAMFSFSMTLAQSNPAAKKLDKIYTLIEKNKIEKAGNELEKLLDEYSSYGKGWDLLAKIKLYEYNEAKKQPNILGGNITVSTKDKDGNDC